MNYIIVIKVIISIHLFTKNDAAEDPPFHMMPLGSHINPTSIEEVTMDNMISPEVFLANHILPQRPLVLRAVTKEWPAFTEWTDAYLKDNHGKLGLRLGRNKEKVSDMPPQGDICLGRDSLARFIDTYHVKDVNKFVESQLPTPLYKYVKIPPPLGCANLSTSIVEVDLWMSSGDVHSSLRKPSLNTITCVVNGTKEWKVVESPYDHLVYQIWRGDTHERSNTDHSLVNPAKVDLKKFPTIAKIPKLLFARLAAGDCLYLPSGSWHTAHSEGDHNVAVAFVFQTFKTSAPFQLEDCADKPNAIPLEEVDPDWKYPGFGRMSMGNSPLSYYVNDVMTRFFSPVDKEVRYENMYKMLIHLMSYMPYSELHVGERAKDLYEILHHVATDAGKDVFTKDMLGSLTRDQLRALINKHIQPPVPENSCDHEYSYFSPDTIEQLFANVSIEDGGFVCKANFTDAYVKMGGHKKIARIMWKQFAGTETKVKFDVYKEHVDAAVQKFTLFWSEKEEPTAMYTAPEEPAEDIPIVFEDDDDSFEQVSPSLKDEL